ncbi:MULTISPECIES: hypothetical protein [unclassified Bradyrhizobium]|uniref:hypothetical protein n=1 Tax=unclassified Bradyrhizobium TaxID=2631580 RepID=UPI003393F0F2
MPTGPILAQRALMLAKIETTYNVDSLPVPATDAFLVSNADVKINPNVLTRDFYRPSMSKLPSAVGRKLASLTFSSEIKGAGGAGSPKLGALLRACGFAQTLIGATAAAVIQNPVASSANTGPAVTWTKAAAATTGFTRYKVKVVLGGASATAKVMVTGNPAEYNETSILPSDEVSATVMGPGKTTTIAVDKTAPLAPTFTVATPKIGDVVVVCIYGIRIKYTIASAVAATEATALAAAITAVMTANADTRFTVAAATAVVTATIVGGVTVVTTATTNINLGVSGGQVNMTWTGSLVLGDSWTVDCLRPGYHYTPVSANFESMTMYMYYDGTLHRLTGCIGTVQFTATAGAFGMAQFTFTGQYNDPDDQPLPLTSVFEPSAPVQVELAGLAVGGAENIAAQSFNIDMGITVNPRESVSHPDGYNGVLYGGRDPKGGFNPEMEFESVEPYWRNLAVATLLRFYARVGTVTGNIVYFVSNTIQLTNVAYSTRNTQRVYDMSIHFVQDKDAGDDELRIVFA